MQYVVIEFIVVTLVVTKKEGIMENKKIYYASTTIAVLLWSASFIATKIAYTMFEPITIGFIRFLIAVVILGVVRLFTKERVRPANRDMAIIALSGLLGITLYFSAENVGVQLTPASNASLIVASYPALTALFEFFIYHTKPTFKKIMGITLAFAGVVILTVKSGNSGDGVLYGNLILIAAGVIWTFYNFVTRSVTSKYSPLTLSYYQMLFGTLFFIPLVLLEGGELHTVTLSGCIATVYLSLGCSVGAFLLYNFGLRKLSASAAVSIMNLVPVFGIIFSALLLQETITLTQIAGGTVVISGVILSSNGDA